MIETLIPSFLPDVSKARRVSFKRPEDIRDDSLAKQEKEKIKQEKEQSRFIRAKFNQWRKDKAKAEKRVTRCKWFLNEAEKALEGVINAKPLSPVVGNPDKRLLESVDVVTPQEIPVFTQQTVR